MCLSWNTLQVCTLRSSFTQCVGVPVIMERRDIPVLLLSSGNLAYTYHVVSYKCYCGIAIVVLLYMFLYV